MNKLLTVLTISALLLTGCSTPTPESKPEYDEVELIRYENCLKLANQVFTGDAIDQVWRDDLIASLAKQIQSRCDYLKPELK